MVPLVQVTCKPKLHNRVPTSLLAPGLVCNCLCTSMQEMKPERMHQNSTYNLRCLTLFKEAKVKYAQMVEPAIAK
jgi:hypothetical protein